MDASPTPEQGAILEAVAAGGHVVVQAAPGAGKTTLLVFLARERLRPKQGLRQVAEDRPGRPTQEVNGRVTARTDAETLPPPSRILWLTYNRHLRLDTLARLRSLGLDGPVDCHTYHSFCTAAFAPAPTDEGIRAVVEGGLPPREYCPLAFDWDLIGLDEAQDLSPLLIRFVRHALGFAPPRTRLLVLGDRHQCVFQWRGSTEAALADPGGTFFGVAPGPEWTAARMLTSFRLHPSITGFLRDVCLAPGAGWIAARPAPDINPPTPNGEGEGSLSSRSLLGPSRRVLYLAGAGTARNLAALVRAMMEDPAIGNHQPGRFFILVPSVRVPGGRSVSVLPTTAVLVELENQLARLGYPIYNPQTDEESASPSASATEGKIVICTYGQSKGRERDIAIVLGFDSAGFYQGCDRDCADASEMPPRLFVACTRAREYLVVVETGGGGGGMKEEDRIAGPLPFLRLGGEGYARLAATPGVALGLSARAGTGWTLFHDGTTPPPPAMLAAAGLSDPEAAQQRCRRAVGARRTSRARARRTRPLEDLVRYWTPEQTERARAALAPYLTYSTEGEGGGGNIAFPTHATVRVRRRRKGTDDLDPDRTQTQIPVADIGYLAVRTVWEVLVRPDRPPRAVQDVMDKVTAAWARECLCEAEPVLSDRLRADWRAVLGAWAGETGGVRVPSSRTDLAGETGGVRVPSSRTDLAGVLAVATQALCWRDEYIARWFALAPFHALTPRARRRVQLQLANTRQQQQNAETRKRKRDLGSRTPPPPPAVERTFVDDDSPAEEQPEFGWLRPGVLDECLLRLHAALGADGAADWEMGRTVAVDVGPGVRVGLVADVTRKGKKGEGTKELWLLRPLRGERDSVPVGLALALLGLGRIREGRGNHAVHVSCCALDPATGHTLLFQMPPGLTPQDLEQAVGACLE